jgi:hypothetical protein
MAETHTNIYPKLVIKNNEHPSRLLAFPFIGILIKCILVIPVAIWVIILSIAYLILMMITPFVILFKGRYWDTAYHFTVGYMKLYTKVALYISGLTDKYPGFDMTDNGIFELHIEKPAHPDRGLSLPLLGIIARVIIMIPYFIYETVLSYGAGVAIVFSWFFILIRGKYPESLYEFVRDSLRVALAETVYTSYLSDNYPSFRISMNHKAIKVLLIIAGSLLFLGDTGNELKNPGTADDERVEFDINNTSNFDIDYKTLPEEGS